VSEPLRERGITWSIVLALPDDRRQRDGQSAGGVDDVARVVLDDVDEVHHDERDRPLPRHLGDDW
jgi:hypothetical protein